MKIVITGGLGFIGQHLSWRLLKEGHHVVVIDALTPQIHGDLPSVEVPNGVEFHRLDICDVAERYEVIEGADAIFHLAAETGTAQSMYRMSHYTRVNCEGTSALLEAVAKCSKRPKRIVLASSRSVYGEGAYTLADAPGALVPAMARTRDALEARQWDPVDAHGRRLAPVPTPEHMNLVPGSIYAATKAAQELLIGSASVAMGLQCVALRFQNVYGEGQSLRNPYTGIISIFFNRARQGLGISVYEDGLESRDFVHVRDVVDALETSLKSDMPSGTVLNIGSGVPTPVQELASTLLRVAKFEVPLSVTGQYRLGDIRHCYADISLAGRYLGFTPNVSLERGLGLFCEWATQQPVHIDGSAKAEAELRARGLTN